MKSYKSFSPFIGEKKCRNNPTLKLSGFINFPFTEVTQLSLMSLTQCIHNSNFLSPPLIAHLHLLVWAMSKQFLLALVTSNGSQWLNQLYKWYSTLLIGTVHYTKYDI